MTAPSRGVDFWPQPAQTRLSVGTRHLEAGLVASISTRLPMDHLGVPSVSLLGTTVPVGLARELVMARAAAPIMLLDSVRTHGSSHKQVHKSYGGDDPREG